MDPIKGGRSRASDARKSVDGLTDEFMNTHIRVVRIKIAENNRTINDLASQLSRLAKALKADEAGRAESGKSLSVINAELQKLRDELEQLDQSIPPRYRLRVHAAQGQ